MLTHELRILTSIERRPDLPEGVTLQEVVLDAVERDGQTDVAAYATLYRVDLDVMRQRGFCTLLMTAGPKPNGGLRPVEIRAGVPIETRYRLIHCDYASVIASSCGCKISSGGRTRRRCRV